MIDRVTGGIRQTQQHTCNANTSLPPGIHRLLSHRSRGVKTKARSLIVVERVRSAGILKIQRRILLIPLLVSELEAVFTLQPAEGLAESEAIVDGVSVNIVTNGIRTPYVDGREHSSARTPRDSEGLGPVLATPKPDTCTHVLAVRAVVAKARMAQHVRVDCVVVPETDVMRSEELVAPVTRGPCENWIR